MKILPEFVPYHNAETADPCGRYGFAEVFPAIYNHKEVCDQTGKNLNHDPVLTPGYKMINSEMFFPPSEKFFNIPPESVNKSNLLRCQIMPVCCNKILRIADPVTDDPDGFFSLISAGSSQ